MARLPTPGSDRGTWGEILNDYLSVAHAADGTLKPIAQSNIAGLGTAASAATTDFATSVQGSKADTALQPQDVLSTPGLAITVAAVDGELPDASIARINAALTSAIPLGGTRMVRLVGDFTINLPIVVPSNTVLDATAASITGATVGQGLKRNLLENMATSTVQRTLSVSTTVSSAQITTTDSFTAADVGRTLIIPGAGGLGNAAVQGQLTGTIITVDSPLQATIDYVALTAVSGAAGRLYDRDKDIRVIGGRWNRGPTQSINGGVWNAHNAVFRRVDGVTVEGMSMQSANGKYSISVADCTAVLVQTIRLNNTSSDGVHLMGPIAHAVIRDIKGFTRDDTIALTARDWDAYNDTMGDITDVLVDEIDATVGAAALLKIIGGRGVKLRRIRVRGLSGYASCGASIKDDFIGSTDIDEVSIEGMRVDLRAATRPALEINVTNGGALSVSNASYSGPAGSHFARINGVWNSIQFSGARMIGQITNARMFYLECTASLVSIRDVSYRGTDNTTGASLVYASTGSTVGLLRLAGINMENGDTVIHLTAGVVYTAIHASDITVTNARRLATFAASSDLTVTNFGGSLASQAIRIENAMTATLRGSSVRNANAWAGVSRASTGVFQVFNPDWAFDLSQAARIAGSRAYNSNAALSCGVGFVICDGTTWKNTFSGLTY